MFPIFYALHSDSQLDFGGSALPEVKGGVTNDPDGFYNPYLSPFCEDECSDFPEE